MIQQNALNHYKVNFIVRYYSFGIDEFFSHRERKCSRVSSSCISWNVLLFLSPKFQNIVESDILQSYDSRTCLKFLNFSLVLTKLITVFISCWYPTNRIGHLLCMFKCWTISLIALWNIAISGSLFSTTMSFTIISE